MQPLAVGQQGSIKAHTPQVQQQLPALGQQEGRQPPFPALQQPQGGKPLHLQAPPPAQQQLPVLAQLPVPAPSQAQQQLPVLGQGERGAGMQEPGGLESETEIRRFENKIQRLELELTEAQCKISDLTAEVNKEKVDRIEAVKAVHKTIKEKHDLEVEYANAVTVIRTQQRDNEEKAEKI